MKLRNVILIILLIIVADQSLKIWIKSHFPFGHVMNLAGLSWAQLYFIENKGMAWGWELGSGDGGKMLLTLFRLAAVIFGSWYLVKIVKQKYSRGFIICAALIYAGALGNLLDSMFYGMIFEDSGGLGGHVAQLFPPHGYAGFLHGRVVDMLYFPMFEFHVGKESFLFFSPIFNLADASISTGVIALLIFQKRFFKKANGGPPPVTIETNAEVNDTMQVS